MGWSCVVLSGVAGGLLRGYAGCAYRSRLAWLILCAMPTIARCARHTRGACR